MSSMFNEKFFGLFRNDLLTKLKKLNRVAVSDDHVPGLRAYISRDLPARYFVACKYSSVYLGNENDVSVDEVRRLARKVRRLAANGVDPTPRFTLQ